MNTALIISMILPKTPYEMGAYYINADVHDI